jgi:hypothetical protein
LSYNVINRKYLLFEALKDKCVLDELFAKMDSAPLHEIPLLIMCGYQKTVTPFDIAVHGKQMTNVRRLYHAMMQHEERGMLHSLVIDRNVTHLWKMGVSLKQYFGSNMVYKRVLGNYPEYHVDERMMLIPSSESSFHQVSYNYERVVGTVLKSAEVQRKWKRIAFWVTITVIFPLLIIYGLYCGVNALIRHSEDAKKARKRKRDAAEEDI